MSSFKGLRHPETLETGRFFFTDTMRLNIISLLLICRACISAQIFFKYCTKVLKSDRVICCPAKFLRVSGVSNYDAQVYLK